MSDVVLAEEFNMLKVALNLVEVSFVITHHVIKFGNHLLVLNDESSYNLFSDELRADFLKDMHKSCAV